MKEMFNPRERRSENGRLVAELLAGSWRDCKPSLSIAQMGAIAQLLLRSGAGGLTWCAIRNSDLRGSPFAELFQAAYRMQTLQSALHERSLKTVIPALRSAGVEPLLVKGWAIARLYPEPGMRPYLDLDLCVLPDDYSRAEAALKSSECQGSIVDLHKGFGKFYDRRTDDIFGRSKLVKLDDVDIRVLGAEDDLRFLCMHMLRHGAMFPLWLCDIGVLLERRSEGFNWDRCLSGSKHEADWVACAIGLANQLLGVNVDGTPVAERAANLPGWLLPAVLEQWGTLAHSRSQIAPLLTSPARIVRELIKELPHHWPNSIEASVALGAPFNRAPRFPLQVSHLISRAAALLMQVFGWQNGAEQKG
jgi:hypothetical protein